MENDLDVVSHELDDMKAEEEKVEKVINHFGINMFLKISCVKYHTVFSFIVSNSIFTLIYLVLINLWNYIIYMTFSLNKLI